MIQLIQTKKLSDLQLPEILKMITQTISPICPSLVNNKIILNILIAKCFQMFTSKRIKLDESGRINLINWFAIIFLPSGGGKDRLVDNMDNFVFRKYHEWYKKEAQNAINKCDNKEIKDVMLINEIQDATSEGVVSLAKIINEVKFGSIFTKFSEFGDYIKNSDNKRKMLLSMLNQMYACVVPTKIIKSEAFSEEIPNIPVSLYIAVWILKRTFKK